MSLTLTAVFDEATGTVDLSATSGVDYAAGAYTLVRTDSSGTAAVRTQEGLGFSGGTLLATDHEPAISGLVTYTLAATGETTVTASVTPSTARRWLGFPLYPQYNLEVGLVHKYHGKYEPVQQLHQIIDRDIPVITYGKIGPRTGQFSILCDTLADAIEIRDAYARIRVAHLRMPAPAGVNMYHTITGLQIDPVEKSENWILTADFQEVDKPAGDLLGTLGWSFDDVTALTLTFDELTIAFPTFNDMTAGVL